MTLERPLKQRIARTFVLLAFILSGFFCLVTYVAVEVIEEQIIDTRLEKIAGTLIARHLKQEPLDPPPEIRFYANENIPAPLRDKEPGLHEIQFDQRDFEALVRFENGNRYAIVQEMVDFEHLEVIIFSSLGVAFVSSLLFAFLLGIATARHIVAPVTALADAITANVDPAKLPSLGVADEIGVLARAFAQRAGEMQRFLMRERLFTGDVSHELRTPLTVILGAAEVLKSQLADRPAQMATAERLRRVAAESAERVSALLLLSRAPEQLGTPRISLNAVIRSELERCEPLLKGKPVTCKFEEHDDISVEARPELAGIAIGNLLRNACQHVEEGSITVRLESGRLALTDTGPGLPESVREHLFDRFVQGRNDSLEGTGLGLSIVKRVADHLGWEARLEQPESGGSRFVLTFPVAPPLSAAT